MPTGVYDRTPRKITDKDYKQIHRLVTLELMFVDERCQIQNQTFFGRAPKRFRYDRHRYKLRPDVKRLVKQNWQEYDNIKTYPFDRLFVLFGSETRAIFTIIFAGKIRWMEDEWRRYKYLMFLPMPEPPSFNSLKKGSRVYPRLVWGQQPDNLHTVQETDKYSLRNLSCKT